VRLESGAASTRLSTRSIGRAGVVRETKAEAVREDDRVVIDRGGVREWWKTAGKQLEFGYDLAERPRGEGPLHVRVGIDGEGTFRVSSEGAVAFVDGPAGNAFEILDLHARDALGRALPAKFAMAEGELAIVVDDEGARYPIVIDPIVASGLETKLSLTGTSAAKFGTVLALSQDGNHLVAKNYGDTSVAFFDYAASAWTAGGSTKFPTASGGLDEFGAFGDGLAFAADGSALVTDYRFKYSGLTWAGAVFAFDGKAAYLTTIKQSGAKSDDQFGFSVSSSGNTIVVGARSTSGSASAAYVFTHTSGTTYGQQAKFAQPSGTNYYGWTTANQGDLAMVSALSKQSFAYRRTGTTWSAARELKPVDTLDATDGYGTVMAVGGTTLLVGAGGRKLTAAGDGQVYVFKDTGTDFVADGTMFAAPPTGGETGRLGSALAITPDGNTAFVGAPAAAAGQGRVYALTRVGAEWKLVRTLVPSDPATTAFGSTLALAGTRLAVGAPSSTAGFIYLYDPALGLDAATKCTSGAECASTFCVDGVCCDSACDGSCEACNLTGKEGTCTAVKGAPIAPRAACPSTGTGVCASTCDGVTRAACVLPGATTECGAASCDTSGGMIGASHCDGAGACAAPAPTSCAPFVCEGGACKTSCTLDTDCADGMRCTSGSCVAATPAGPHANVGLVQRCSADGECATGHCSDGVCCDQACKEKCSSCAVPGFIGKCLPESGIDLRNDCNSASCTSSCQAGDCRPARAGDQCAPSLCVDETTAQGPSTCSAAGSACTASTGTLDCKPYVCALGACLTSCVDSSQCAAGSVCDTASQHCVVAPEESTGGCTYGASGGSSGVVALALLAVLEARRRRAR
jgi:hypothetical protein